MQTIWQVDLTVCLWLNAFYFYSKYDNMHTHWPMVMTGDHDDDYDDGITVPCITNIDRWYYFS